MKDAERLEQLCGLMCCDLLRVISASGKGKREKGSQSLRHELLDLEHPPEGRLPPTNVHRRKLYHSHRGSIRSARAQLQPAVLVGMRKLSTVNDML